MTEAEVCVLCLRPVREHTLDESRACLAAIERIEAAAYCRLTGPKKVAA